MIRMFRKLLVWLIQWATAADQVAAPLGAPTEQPTPADSYLHFGPPTERNIFRYWDGTKERAADPMVLWEKVIIQSDAMRTVFAHADMGDIEGIREASGMICDILGVHEFDPVTETGLTREELNNLMVLFIGYVNDLKKKLAHLPMPSRHLGSTSSPAEPPVSTTPLESDCCSTESVSSDAEPTTP